MSASRSRVHLLLLGFAVVAAGLVTRASLRSALALRSTWPREADTSLMPSGAWLRVASLGHPEAAADLVAARANVYFGAQIGSHGEQRWLGRMLTTAVDLDPRFHRLYLRGAAMLVYNGRDFTVESLLAADDLLERGIRQFPDDWELRFQRGFNLLFELPKLVGEDDSRVLDWRQRGVDALREATLLDGAPPWLANLAASMLTRQGSEELAIRHLERTFEVTSDPETRAAISRQLATLRGRRLAEELRAGAAALEQLLARGYPYAPEAFSLILGPRLSSGIDLDQLLGRGPVAARPTTPPATPEP